MRAYEFLFEGKEEKIWKDWGDRLYQKLLSDRSFPIHVSNINTITDPVKESIRQEYNNSLARADPSRNKDYHTWISRLYLKNNFLYEDIGTQVHDALIKYHRMKLSNQLPDVRYKDINFFASLQDLVHILPESGSEVVNNKGKYKVLADDSTCFVAQVLDVHAAIYFGQGTNPTWCVSYPIDDPRNKWDEYKDDGPIYVILPKVNKNHVNEKYLWGFEVGQVKDRENNDLSEEELESLITRCPVVKKLFSKKLARYNIEFGFLFYSIEELVKYNGEALSYANNELRSNYDIVKLAVSQNGAALYYANNELRSNYDIVKLAVSQNGAALYYASDELKNNPEIVKLAVSQNGAALQYANNKFRSNYEIVKIAVSNNGAALSYASKELQNNYDIVELSVNNDGLALQYASKELQNNYDIVELSVNNDGLALQYASVFLQDNSRIVELAIRDNPHALQDASDELKNNPEIVKLAVSQNGAVLEYASKELKSNSEIVKLAVSQNGEALYYANNKFRKHPKYTEIAKLAVATYSLIYVYLDKKISSNPEVQEIESNPSGKLAQKYRQLGQSIVAKAKSELGIE